MSKFLVTITFAYEDGRDDPHSDYRAGFEIRTAKRCKSILVETHAATKRPVREYQFGYRSDPYNGVSLLESVALVERLHRPKVARDLLKRNCRCQCHEEHPHSCPLPARGRGTTEPTPSWMRLRR